MLSIKKLVGSHPREKAMMASVLVLLGVFGRIALINHANIETILAVSLIAGLMLGGIYALLVPLLAAGISDALIYALNISETYGLGLILALALFSYSGFAFAGLIGFSMRKKIAYTANGIATVTLGGVIATLIFDAWTAFGIWLLWFSKEGITLGQTFTAQVPFTLYHLLSSVIFVPLLATMFLVLNEHKMRFLDEEASPSQALA